MRTLQTGEVQKNIPNPAPTGYLLIDGQFRPFVYEDGIAVNSPESEWTVNVAKETVDVAVIVDGQQTFRKAGPLLYRYLAESVVYPNADDICIGGTTALCFEVLLEYGRIIDLINKADV